MENSDPSDNTVSAPAKQSKAVADWTFFRSSHWVSISDEATNSSTECRACRNFPAGGEHSRICIVRELEERLLENVTAEKAAEMATARHDSAIGALQQEKQQLTVDIVELQELGKALQTEKEDLQRKLVGLEESKNRATTDQERQLMATQQQQLTAETRALELKLKVSTTSRTQLKNSIIALTEKLSHAQQQTQRLGAQQTTTQDELHALKSQLSAAEQANLTMKTTNDALSTRNNTLTAQIQDLSHQLSHSTDSALQKLTEIAEEHARGLDERDKQISEHEERWRVREEAMVVTTRAHAQESEALARKQRDTESVNEELRGENSALGHANAALRAEIADVTARLQSAMEGLQECCNDAPRIHCSSYLRHTEIPEACEDLLIQRENDTIAHLQHAISQTKAENVAKKEELARKREGLRRLDAEIGRLRPVQEFLIKDAKIGKGRGRGRGRR